MAIFNRETTMKVTNEDRVCLTYGQIVLEQIEEKMRSEGADYIERIACGDILEYDDIRIALNIIERLLEEEYGKDWKLV